MDNQDYWHKKHQKYSTQDWIRTPTIFATQILKYLPKSGSLLELGCGQGQDSIYFAQHDLQVTATDFSDFALFEAKQTTPPGLKDKITYQVVDIANKLPFPQASFDIVYSHLAVHYFDKTRTQQLFDEIYTTLKPGGIFAILVNTLDDPEIGESQLVETDLYITPSGLQKRFFSVDSVQEFTAKFETLLLDNHGETHKDTIKTLIRYVGKKKQYE